MSKWALQSLRFMMLAISMLLSTPLAWANIQTINAIATGVATTTQALARGTDPNAPQPVTVQSQQLQPIATATPQPESPPPAEVQQPSAVAPNSAASTTQASSSSETPTTASQPASTATDSTSATNSSTANPSTTDSAPTATASEATATASPPPVNVTPTATAEPTKGEVQTIEGIYAYGLPAEQELKVKIVIAPRALGQGKTDLAQALEGVTAMVCIDKGNCQYAFPSKEGYFESVLKMPATLKAEEPQTHSVPIFVVACSSLGCVKSKVNTQVQFGT